MWDGLFHGFFYNADVPESRDAFNVMINFFDRNLATRWPGRIGNFNFGATDAGCERLKREMR